MKPAEQRDGYLSWRILEDYKITIRLAIFPAASWVGAR